MASTSSKIRPQKSSASSVRPSRNRNSASSVSVRASRSRNREGKPANSASWPVNLRSLVKSSSSRSSLSSALTSWSRSGSTCRSSGSVLSSLRTSPTALRLTQHYSRLKSYFNYKNARSTARSTMCASSETATSRLSTLLESATNLSRPSGSASNCCKSSILAQIVPIPAVSSAGMPSSAETSSWHLRWRRLSVLA